MNRYPRFLKSATRYAAVHVEQRKGQAFMNALYIQYPEIADKIRATELDPFYDNSRLPAFLVSVEQRLDSQP